MSRYLLRMTTLLMLFTVSAFALTPAPAAAQQPAAKPTVTWRLHGDQPVTFWWSTELEKFTKDVDRSTSGGVKLEFFPSASLGVKPGDILAPVRSGSIEMAEFVASYVAGEAPYLTVLGLPMLAASVEKGRKITDATRAEIEKELAAKYDLRVLSTLSSSPMQLYLGKKSFSDIESLRGLRIRTLGVDQELFIKSLGAAPVNVPVADIPMALATNQIDGAIAGTQMFVSQKYSQYGPNILAWNAILGPGFLVVGQKKWASLNPQLQEAIIKTAKSFEDGVWARAASLEKEMQAQAERDGFKILQLSDRDRDGLAAKAEPTWSIWAEKAGPLGKKLLDIAMQARR